MEGREGRGKKRRCLPGRGGRTHPSGSLQGVGRVLGGERGGEGSPGGGGPAAEPHASYPGAGAAGQLHGREGGGVLPSTPRWIGVVAWRTRGSDLSGRTRGHGSPRDSISELLRSVPLG